MFNILRWLERWLHQHIFKVGWLITKNFQTTTLFYYTFFLPGVVLYELVYWLVAGALDVHADRAITWPEQQEIGELRLNFVKLSSKASPLQVAIISASPLLAGLGVISFIAYNTFNVTAITVTTEDGVLDSIASAIQQIMTVPDFWLWAYILFTIGNTMMPEAVAFKRWRWIVVIGVLATIPLFIIGVGDEVVGSAITGPIADMLNVLSTIFVVLIVADIIAVGILSAIENTIERITGDSATFKNGKMVVMRREEMIAQRKQARQKERSAHRQKGNSPTIKGTPSVYKLLLPIPRAPGKEPVTTLAALVAETKKEAKSDKTSRPNQKEPVVTSTTHHSSDEHEPVDSQSLPQSGSNAPLPPKPSGFPKSRFQPGSLPPKSPTATDEFGHLPDDGDVSYEDVEDSP